MPALSVGTMNDAADAYAVESIGRPLTNEEKIDLLQYMRQKRDAERGRIDSLTPEKIREMQRRLYARVRHDAQ